MSVGFLSQGFFADNGGKFANIKLYKSISKLGLTVRFRPSYSPSSNGLNEQYNACADITIKKLMEEHKVPLSVSLVKAAP